jgi:predicted ATPase
VSVLLERGAELDRLRGLVRRAAGGEGAVVAIEGPPGIGKTRLGQEAVALAGAEGLTVLCACGSELEQEFGFGAVRQLFEPVVANVDERRQRALFEGAARLAAPALGLESDTPPAEGRDARFPVVHGLYWLTANLAGDAALLLWVDDLQWVDRPSQRFLAYLSRRLGDLPALLVVGLRPALPGEERAEADAIAAARWTLVLRPAPLSVEGVAALAERRLGSPPDRRFAEECRRVTGGNVLVEDVLTELEETGRPADAETARELGMIGIERVGRGVRRRLESLPSAAVELGQAVAVLGDGSSLETTAALAGLATGDAVPRRRGSDRGRPPHGRCRSALPSPAGPGRGGRSALAGGARSRPRTGGSYPRRA